MIEGSPFGILTNLIVSVLSIPSSKVSQAKSPRSFFELDVPPSCNKFYEHFTNNFFAQKCFAHLFSNYSSAL